MPRLRLNQRIVILSGFWAGRSGYISGFRACGYVLVQVDGGGPGGYTLRSPDDVKPVSEILARKAS